MTAVFRKTLVREFHVRSFEIVADAASGWQVFERDDERVFHRQYTDWHRVERAAMLLERVVGDLRRDGWHELPTAG